MIKSFSLEGYMQVNYYGDFAEFVAKIQGLEK